METLRYADELQKAQGFFREIPDDTPDADLLDLAESLIAKKQGEFHPDEFKNRYVDALKDLIERKKKAKGRKIVADEEPEEKRGGNVIDLMAALKKSLEKPGAKPAAAKPAAKKKAAPRKKAA